MPIRLHFTAEPSNIRTKSNHNISVGDSKGDLNLVEPLLSGIVLGLIPITLAGLFVAAYLQYKRGNQLGL